MPAFVQDEETICLGLVSTKIEMIIENRNSNRPLNK